MIVSLSFLGWIGPGNGCTQTLTPDQEKGAYAGKLYGKGISHRQLALARIHEMNFKEDRLPPSYAKMLDQYAWRRLAVLHASETMGLGTLPEEVSEQIYMDKSFQANGQFDRARYDGFIRQQFGGDHSSYENYLKESLTIQKALATIMSAHLTAPTEIMREITARADSFSAEYVLVKPDEKLIPEITEKDAEAFYNDHKKIFQVPEQVQVKYASFPIVPAPTNVLFPESAIKEYHEDHPKQFSRYDSNKNDFVDIPIEEAREEIIAQLRRDEAVNAARSNAMDFVLAVTPNRREEAMAPEAAAAKARTTLATTPWFSKDSTIDGLDVDYEFNKAAFDLDPKDKRNMVSDPIVYSNMVYVVVAYTNKSAYQPSFLDVKVAATAYARTNAQEKAFIDNARKMRDKIRQEVAGGKSFKDAASGLGLAVTTTGVFSAIQDLTNSLPYAETVRNSVFKRNKGDITSPIRVDDGAVIVYIADRQPAGPESAALMRQQVMRYMENVNAMTLFAAWGEYLLSKGNFENLQGGATPGTDETPDKEPPLPDTDS